MLDRVGQLPGIAQFGDRAVELLAEHGRLLRVLEMIGLIDLVDARQRCGLHLRPVGELRIVDDPQHRGALVDPGLDRFRRRDIAAAEP